MDLLTDSHTKPNPEELYRVRVVGDPIQIQRPGGMTPDPDAPYGQFEPKG